MADQGITQVVSPAPPPPPSAAPAGATTPPLAPVPHADDWSQYVDPIAQHYGVDPELMRRVIQTESSGNPYALGPERKGARAVGLMQLMPSTAERLGVNPRDPLENMMGGAKELKRLMDKYGHLGKAIAAYNTGEGNVDKAKGYSDLPQETQDYLVRILGDYKAPQRPTPGGALQQAAPVPPTAPVPPDQAPGFIQSYGAAVGAPERPEDIITGPLFAIQHPLEAAKLLGPATLQAHAEAAQVAREHMAQPGVIPKLVGGVEYLEAGIPFFGPSLVQAGQQFERGQVRGGLGTTAGLATILGMGKFAEAPETFKPYEIPEKARVPAPTAARVEPGTQLEQEVGRHAEAAQQHAANPVTQAREVVSTDIGLKDIPVAPMHPEEHTALERVAGRSLTNEQAIALQDQLQIQRRSYIPPEERTPVAAETAKSASDADTRGQITPAGPTPEPEIPAARPEPAAPPPPPSEYDPAVLSRRMQNDALLSNKLSGKELEDERALAQQSIDARVASGTVEDRTALKDTSDRFLAQAAGIRQLLSEDEAARKIRDSLVEMKAPRAQKRFVPTGEFTEEGKPVVEFEAVPSLVQMYGRSLLADVQGLKQRLGQDWKEAFPRPMPENWTGGEARWNEVRDFGFAQWRELGQEIIRDVQVAKETGGEFDQGALLEKIQDFDRLGRQYAQMQVTEEAAAQPKPTSPTYTGKTPGPGVRRGLTAEEPAPAEPITQARINQIFGRRVADIPTGKAALAKYAEHLEDAAGMFKEGATRIHQKLMGRSPEGGFIGPRPETRFTIAPERLDSAKIAKNAKVRGLDVKPVSDLGTGPTENQGWITPDGNYFLSHAYRGHEEMGMDILRGVLKPEEYERLTGITTFSDALLQNGFVRKSLPTGFQIFDTTPKALDIVERDLIRNGQFKNRIFLDVNQPKLHGIEIDPYWDNFEAAVKKGRRIQPFSLGEMGTETGAISGVETMGGMAVGGLAGAKVGTMIGGFPIGTSAGAIVGATVGGLSPAVMRAASIKEAFGMLAPIVRRGGISMDEFLFGKPQTGDGISPRMASILDEQHKFGASHNLTIMDRLHRLPAQLISTIRPSFYANDQLGAFTRWLTGKDPAIAGKLRGPHDPSVITPYTHLYNLSGQISGWGKWLQHGTADIRAAAEKADVGPQLEAYLNLDGYERTYRNLYENVSELQQDIQTQQQRLQGYQGMGLQEIANADKRLKTAQAELRDLQERLDTGKVNPKGYMPPDIARERADLLKAVGPERAAKIQDLANELYRRGDEVLDFIHDQGNGFMSDAEYAKYKARGPQYVPMKRILDRAENFRDQIVTTRPAWLKARNSIKEMEGSARTNQNPFVAWNFTMNKVVSEALRNNVASQYIDDPLWANEFRQVSADYVPKKGEAIVGRYENGAPRRYVTHERLADALMNGDPAHLRFTKNVVQRFFDNAARVSATTAYPAFYLTRIARDFKQTVFVSRAGAKGPADVPRAAFAYTRALATAVRDVWNESPEYQQFVRAGGSFGQIWQAVGPETRVDMSRLQYAGKRVAATVNVASKLAHIVTDADKLAGWKLLKQQGWADPAAAMEAHGMVGLPDLQHGSGVTNAMNAAFMFSKARMEDIVRDAVRLGQDPKRMLKMGGLFIAANLALNMWNWSQKDENGEPLMRQFSPSQRDRNTIILLGGRADTVTGRKVPNYIQFRKSSFETVYTAPIENTIGKLMGIEDRTGRQLVKDTILNFSPVNIPSAPGQSIGSTIKGMAAGLYPTYKVPIQQLGGFEGQTGRPIVPPGAEKFLPGYAPAPGTEPASIAAGKALGISPERIQNIVEGVLPRYGALALQAMRGQFPPNPRQLEEARQQSLFAGVQPYQNAAFRQKQAEFYNYMDQAALEANTLGRVQRLDPKSYQLFKRQYPDSEWKQSVVQMLQANLKDVSDMENAVRASGLSANEKAQIWENLAARRSAIYDAGIGLFKGRTQKPGDMTPTGAPDLTNR